MGGAMLFVTAASASLLSEAGRACELQSTNCNPLLSDYGRSFDRFTAFVSISGWALPSLVGIFVGAPLVAREYEQGTHLLVWAQGITRSRWFVGQLGLLAAATVTVSCLLGAAYETWFAPRAFIANQWDVFDFSPVTLASYSVFALAIGTASGALIQRTLPAVAATLAIFIALRFAVENFLRPMYLPPLTTEFGTNPPGGSSSAPWYLSNAPIDQSGHQMTNATWNQAVQQCSSDYQSGSGSDIHDCLVSHGVRWLFQYQPGSRFWIFQGIEAVIFLALAILLIAIAYRLVLRKT
jgi:hypothetical protein